MKRTRQIYLGCLMIVLVQCRRHHEFSYGGHRYGPAKWSETWRECGGKRQSPINLDTSKCTRRNFKLKFNNHGEICRGYLINNGHAPTFVVRKCNKKKYITGVPFFPKVGYQLAQWHFHFGSKRDWGTEHAINGKRYTAELHMVHFNTKYRTVTNAIDKKDGIAVVAILFEEDPDAQLSSIERFFRKYGSHVNRPGHAVKSLFNPVPCIPKSSEMFFYKGSLTTPGCYESVNWLIFKERQAISPRTMAFFRKLQTYHHKVPIADLTNLRPLQTLGNRNLYCNF
ncbi:carbonic anhydrase 2-like [Ostrea edulis]|uniref:carbonic anhydrase 2-like n=1 Tax=Ostrea edulis TaxID=37623 RepID=UPI0024AF4F9C|nr:carbonic anhydrase 2-like [Ostrea edulis]